MIVAAVRQLKHTADHYPWIIWREQFHKCPFLLWCDRKISEAFLAISSSSVFCPSSRSSSLMRLWLSSVMRAWAKSCSAFHEANNCGLIWCSRQTSAAVFAPLKTSRTMRALNSALNARRFLMTVPFLGLILLHLHICPSFGVHYSCCNSA
jgi:hypothetical protein